jgi:hypothetical protein
MTTSAIHIKETIQIFQIQSIKRNFANQNFHLSIKISSHEIEIESKGLAEFHHLKLKTKESFIT